MPALSDLKMLSQSALWYFRNSWLNLRKSEISHQFTRHFGTDTSLPGGLSQLMAYFGNTSRQLLESLQVLEKPIQISEKLELITKIMFGCHGNNKSADFLLGFQ